MLPPLLNLKRDGVNVSSCSRLSKCVGTVGIGAMSTGKCTDTDTLLPTPTAAGVGIASRRVCLCLSVRALTGGVV